MIHCRELEKRFHARSGDTLHWRLDHLSVPKGERLLITGPSGCGKTTFLNLVSGLVRADHGSIAVDGIQVDELNTSEADVFRGRHIGLIFQSFQLIAQLSVLDNVLLGARFGRKWSGRDAYLRAESLLTSIHLGDRFHHRPSELSLGEQQRVAIARALINEPSLLLADEPTASLDAANSATVLDLLFDLCADKGTTLVVISHDTSIKSRFDRVVDAGPWMQSAKEALHV